MDPESLLNVNCRMVTCVQLPMVVGMVPHKADHDRTTCRRLVMAPISLGKVPLSCGLSSTEVDDKRKKWKRMGQEAAPHQKVGSRL